MTPLDHFVKTLRARMAEAEPAFSNTVHTHPSELKYPPDQNVECEPRCEAPFTLSTSPVDRLVSMPLTTFAVSSLVLRLWSRVLDEQIWFVSGEAEMQSLMGKGVPRRKIHTAQELLTLLNLPWMDRERLKRIHEAKELFSGTVPKQGTPNIRISGRTN